MDRWFLQGSCLRFHAHRLVVVRRTPSIPRPSWVRLYTNQRSEWDLRRPPVAMPKRYLVPVDQRSAAKPKKIVQTLERANLSQSDHLELSNMGRFVIQCDPTDDSPELRARLTMHPKDDQPFFPEHTQGFLYFVSVHPAVQLASQVRFRLTRDDDPGSFGEGNDLLNPDYTPWNIPLVSIARIPRLAGLRHLLIKDALVPPLAMETAAGLDVRIGPPAKIIHSFGQLFSLEFTALKPIFCFASATTMHQKALRIYEDWRGEASRKAVYKGSALCCFEQSTLPAHEGTRTMVLRVKKITRTIINARPMYDGWIPPPQEGQLIMSRSKVTEELEPWSFNIEHTKGHPVMQALFRDSDDTI